MTTRAVGLADLKARVGEHLGPGEWVTVTQERVDAFADATGDHQWIHVDVERARRGPFGGSKPACVAQPVFRYLGEP